MSFVIPMAAPLMSEHDRAPLLVFGDDGTVPLRPGMVMLAVVDTDVVALGITIQGGPKQSTAGDPKGPVRYPV